ncbi:pleiotropic regulatory protein RsmS [Rahnella inusitata]|uniref:pleiotropic regulatory protein RsmS n=1 Tax=Rahnella inusitata TaxID=58169 RepID=UPI0039AF2C8D
MSVENAPPELQLAVDLIYLLECNEIAPETALAALEIVQRDYQEKLKNNKSSLSISYL